MLISRRIRSGCNSCAFRSASEPSLASPQRGREPPYRIHSNSASQRPTSIVHPAPDRSTVNGKPNPEPPGRGKAFLERSREILEPSGFIPLWLRLLPVAVEEEGRPIVGVGEGGAGVGRGQRLAGGGGATLRFGGRGRV